MIFLQLKIQNGVVELSGNTILSSVNFEVNDTSHIAVVGRNGCGKTTLLKLITGDYKISKADSDKDSFFTVSGNPKIGVLSQIAFEDSSVKMIDEIRKSYSDILSVKSQLDKAEKTMADDMSEKNIADYTNLLDTFTNLGGFYFEREYESALKSFGFSEADKQKSLSMFSGGQLTRIAFLKLLLSKPDILLLDEPTNHLDIEATSWLEDYLSAYKGAFVVVSHDRMFLDNVANTVYEIENGKTHKYNGNYTEFLKAKAEARERRKKEFEAQKKEIERIEAVVEKFRYKATKAAMAQSKLKQIERMDKIEAPEKQNLRQIKADFEPDDLGTKEMLSVENLGVGYDSVLSNVNLTVHQGERIGIIGANGLGKSTFIRTILGEIPALSGKFNFSQRAKIGYFDQKMAEYISDKTVIDDFWDTFPALDEFEVRSSLAAFLFTGEDVFKKVTVLSGGELVRLALCKIFKRKPNFLILDEPTNHMDILGKESLEEMLKNYSGTVLFVSHDRYFVKQIADKILDFTKGETSVYDFGYDYYIEKKKDTNIKKATDSDTQTKVKKTYTTPLKEKDKREKALKKAETEVARLEKEFEAVSNELSLPENISDYLKLSELTEKQSAITKELENAMNVWEKLAEDG